MKIILGLILAMPMLTSCAPGALWSNASAVSGWSYYSHQADCLSDEGMMVIKQQIKIELHREGIISAS